MGSRLLIGSVVVATLLSATVLGVMLAAPFMPQVSRVAAQPTATPSPEATPDAQLPLGLFLLRGPYAFGPCLGIELEPTSFPTEPDGDPGRATVIWWERGVADPGNPDACATRTGELNQVGATVEVDFGEGGDDPEEPVAYIVGFSMPTFGGQPVHTEITILARQSTPDLLQATAEGQGLVLDRVEVIDPPDRPLPSPSAAAFEPHGLFFLAGPLGGRGGPCLVLDLDVDAFPTDPLAAGSAVVRWWEHEGAATAADCLTRTGPVGTEVATVARSEADGGLAAYQVRFRVAASSGTQQVEIRVLIQGSTPDQLQAQRVVGGTVTPLRFDRVDEIDPPLVSP